MPASCCPVVTTCPTVVTAVCWTTPSIGAWSSCARDAPQALAALARLVRLARGVRELVLIVGDELRNRLRLLALQFPERCVGFDQLALVGGEVRLRLLQLLLGVVQIDLGADVEVDRLLSGRTRWFRRVHELLLVGDAHVETLLRREFLRLLLVERFQGVLRAGGGRRAGPPPRAGGTARAKRRPRRSSGRARRPGLRPDRRRIAPRRPYPLRSARTRRASRISSACAASTA